MQANPVLYLGGTYLYRIIAGQNAWEVTNIGHGIHPDQHAIAFHPDQSNKIYAGTDGGIYVSEDGGASWSDRVNYGLCIAQYESICHHPKSEAFLLGGTQDNGTHEYRNSPVFFSSDRGDGGFVAIDPRAPRVMLHTYFDADPARSEDAGATWLTVKYGIPVPVDSSGQPIVNSCFYPPLVLDDENSGNVAIGTNAVVLDDDQGRNLWREVVPLPLDPSEFVSALNYHNSSLIYAGTTAGKVFRLQRENGVWVPRAIHNQDLPKRWIWEIVTLPGKENSIIVAMAEYGFNSHVWRADNANSAADLKWKEISGSTGLHPLGDVPVNTLAIDPANADCIYAGTEVGVSRTTNGGADWQGFCDGLPNTSVYDLKFDPSGRLLRAATHGRGIWERRLDAKSASASSIGLRRHLLDARWWPPASSPCPMTTILI